MNFSDVLRAWRHHHQLSIREAAKRIGVDWQCLYRIEQDKGVNQATILQVWRWLIE